MQQTGTPYYLIDFDSTFTKVEALDILGEIALHNKPERETVLAEISKITDLGMTGELGLKESLARRLQLLQANKSHLPALVSRLQQEVTESVKRNRAFLQEYRNKIYIISNGFHEFIEPVVAGYGIGPGQVLANNFVFDNQGNIVDFDRDNVLSGNRGKAQQVALLNLQGEVWMIGDGYTDYEVRAAGQATLFIAFTENINRPQVVAKADFVANRFEDIIFLSNGQKTIVPQEQN